jgi:hypothetical protein
MIMMAISNSNDLYQITSHLMFIKAFEWLRS